MEIKSKESVKKGLLLLKTTLSLGYVCNHTGSLENPEHRACANLTLTDRD